jgi:hypothetical protein
MKRNIAIMILGVMVLVGLVGCIGFNTNWEPSWTDNYQHEKRHLKAFWQDMGDVHRFIDKYILNFDEDDPRRY